MITRSQRVTWTRRRSVFNRRPFQRTGEDWCVTPCSGKACRLVGDLIARGVRAPFDPEAKTMISDYPPSIPPLFSHYPVTIWRRRSESHCVTASFQSSQPPCKSINYARSPVKSGFQRPLRKSRTILPIAFQNFLTILPVSFYWSFYWRSLPGFVEVSPGQKHYPLPPE